jgi:anaerobic magnesium-protoporphyrin IX monomethyl ester cyclase
MKVLLCNPSKWGRGITPIWIAAHSARLKATGHDVELFDATFFSGWTDNETAFNTGNNQYQPTDYESQIIFFEEDVFTALQNKVDSFEPDIIFWSAISSHIHGEGEYVNFQYGYELLSSISFSGKKVAGGLQITAKPDQISFRYPNVDYFISGESEFPLASLCDALQRGSDIRKIHGLVFRDGDRLIQTPRQNILSDLDEIGFYDYSIFEPQVFLRPYNGEVVRAVDYELSRGCIYSCGYCVETIIQKYYGFTETNPNTGSIKRAKEYLRHKSASRVYAELNYLADELGVSLVRCQDTNFLTINRPMLKELAELMDRHPLNLKLYIETRPDDITERDVDLLKRLRVDGVGMGIEMASESFRNDSLLRFANQEKIKAAFDRLARAGIKRTAYNIIGLPGEDEAMINETITFNRELKPDNITVAFYSPYIGTRQEQLSVDMKIFEDYEMDVDGQLRSVPRNSAITEEKLNYYKREFVNLVREGMS